MDFSLWADEANSENKNGGDSRLSARHPWCPPAGAAISGAAGLAMGQKWIGLPFAENIIRWFLQKSIINYCSTFPLSFECIIIRLCYLDKKYEDTMKFYGKHKINFL